MRISCKENCRMTKKIRHSHVCTQMCTVSDDGVVFDCENNLKTLSEEKINEYSCLFLDLNALNKCNSCFLKCGNNKNPELEKKEREIIELQKALDTINNFGVSAQMADDIVKKYEKSQALKTDDIKALGFSNAVLSKAMSGSGFDISHFQMIAKNFIKNIKNRC